MKNLYVLAVLAVALVVGGAVQAAPAEGPSTAPRPTTGWIQTVALEGPASDGGSSFGILKMGGLGSNEYFRLRVYADLPDGTILPVIVEREVASPDGQDTFTVGTIEIQLGSGQLYLRSDVGYSVQVFPLSGLERVMVEDEGAVFLMADIL